jgi:hypothetical protein
MVIVVLIFVTDQNCTYIAEVQILTGERYVRMATGNAVSDFYSAGVCVCVCEHTASCLLHILASTFWHFEISINLWNYLIEMK